MKRNPDKSVFPPGLARRAVAVLAAGAGLLPMPLLAGDWDTGAGLSVSSYFSDNICRSDLEKKEKFVGTATPNVRLSGDSARARMNLDAAVEYNSLAESDLDCPRGFGQNNRETFVPRVRFDGALEAIENWLTLEADAFADQNRTNPFAAGGEDNLDGSGNTNITYRYSVGAVVDRRLPADAELLLRYTYDEQHNERSQIGDSTQHSTEFELGTSTAKRLALAVGARYQEVEYDDTAFRAGSEAELAAAEVRAFLQLNSDWQLNGLVGEEWNDFVSVFQDDDGSYWDAGLTWTPNSRVEVAVGYGERFFGSTPRAEISYRHKHSELQLSYTRNVNTTRNLRTLSRFGDSDIADVPGDGFDEGGIPTLPFNTVTINEQFSMAYRLEGRRNTLALRASDSRQTRGDDNQELTFSRADLTLSRSLGRRLSADFRLSWDEREGEGDFFGFQARDSETWRVGLSFTRGLGNATSLTLGYTYTTRDSELAIDDYDENRVVLSLRHEFF